MSLTSKILGGSAVLGAGEITSYGCSFVRNVILARVLTKADFGVAATFAITVSLLEIAGKLAINSLIIQSKEGDDPKFQATAHTVQLLAGVIGIVLISALAHPLAYLFNVPDAGLAFQLLALIPLMKGLEHLDTSRMVRQMRYGPLVMVNAVPQVIVTLFAWPMATWLDSYWALLWLLLAKWAMTTVGTHILAERPYRFGWSREAVERVASFGWPLLVNGFLMFAIFQGDRVVVGSGFTVSDLAVYSVAASLSLVPGLMFIKVLGQIMLPMMSQVQDSPELFTRRYAFCAQSLALFAAVFGLTMAIAGEAIVSLVYGEKYAGAGLVLAWLAAGQSLRVMRAGPTIAAMARGDTRNLMLSNMFRVTGLGLVFVVVISAGPLHAVAMAGLAGEALAFTFSLVRLSNRHGLRLADGLGPAAFAIVSIVVAAALSAWVVPADSVGVVLATVLVLSLLSVAAALALFQDIRKPAYELAGVVWARCSRCGSRFETSRDRQEKGRQ